MYSSNMNPYSRNGNISHQNINTNMVNGQPVQNSNGVRRLPNGLEQRFDGKGGMMQSMPGMQQIMNSMGGVAQRCGDMMQITDGMGRLQQSMPGMQQGMDGMGGVQQRMGDFQQSFGSGFGVPMGGSRGPGSMGRGDRYGGGMGPREPPAREPSFGRGGSMMPRGGGPGLMLRGGGPGMMPRGGGPGMMPRSGGGGMMPRGGGPGMMPRGGGGGGGMPRGPMESDRQIGPPEY